MNAGRRQHDEDQQRERDPGMTQRRTRGLAPLTIGSRPHLAGEPQAGRGSAARASAPHRRCRVCTSQTMAPRDVAIATRPPTRIDQRAPNVSPIQPMIGAPTGVPPMKIAM